MSHRESAAAAPAAIDRERGLWAERIATSLRGVDAELARLRGPADAESQRALEVVRDALRRGAVALGTLPH